MTSDFVGELPPWAVPAATAVLALIALAGCWRVYRKAGQPGWGVLVPLYNLFLLVRIANCSVWWFILLLVPGVNLVIFVLLCIQVSRNFDRGLIFGLGLAFLGVLFYPLLGFSRARYQPFGPSSEEIEAELAAMKVEVTEPTGTGRPI